MKKFRILGGFLIALGIDPRKIIASIRFLPTFISGYFKIKNQKSKIDLSNDSFNVDNFSVSLFPILSDCYMEGGTTKGHYFHQDLWAAREIFKIRPESHIDVGSRVDGFVTHLLTFMDVKIVDIRPIKSDIKGLTFIQADLMSENLNSLNSLSVSCLHALEHFGLGRYGDPIDFDGYKKGLKNLSNMVSPGGHLFISMPIGNKQILEFNAQRIFDPRTIPILAESYGMDLVDFSWVDDDGFFHESSSINDVKCSFGCGCYKFYKPKN